MPGFVWLLASGWRDDPEKFALAIELSRITFPYLIFISLVSLFSGVLNSLTRFAAAAFAPALLNLALIAAQLLVPEGGAETARAMAIGVIAGGVLQLALCWASVRRLGLRIGFRRPRMTGRVRELLRPDPAGDFGQRHLLYQPALLRLFRHQPARRQRSSISASPTGSTSCRWRSSARRSAPRSCRRSAAPSTPATTGAPPTSRARRPSSPCCSPCRRRSRSPSPRARSSPPCSRAAASPPRTPPPPASSSSIIVAGLPAYVLIKVLTPGFYARKDMKTPVYIAFAMLGARRRSELRLDPRSRHRRARSHHRRLGLAQRARALRHPPRAAAISGSSPGSSVRILKQLLAAAAMAGVLWLLQGQLDGWFAGSAGRRDHRRRRARRRPALWSISLWPGPSARWTRRTFSSCCGERKRRKRDSPNQACRLRHPADRQPPPRQLSRRDPALGEAAGRGRMPDLPRRSPRHHRL